MIKVVLEVKNPPAHAGDIRDESSVLGWEDPLEEGIATHSSNLAWRIPWTEEPGRLRSTGSQTVGHDWSSLACVVQLLSHVRLFVTPWTAAPQASLSFTISWILLKLKSIESMMPFESACMQVRNAIG